MSAISVPGPPEELECLETVPAQFHHLLVGWTGSRDDSLLRYAASVASANRARITVAFLPERWVWRFLGKMSVDTWTRVEEAEVQLMAKIRLRVQRLPQELSVTTIVQPSAAPAALVDAALRQRCCAIVTPHRSGSRQHSQIARALRRRCADHIRLITYEAHEYQGDDE